MGSRGTYAFQTILSGFWVPSLIALGFRQLGFILRMRVRIGRDAIAMLRRAIGVSFRENMVTSDHFLIMLTR